MTAKLSYINEQNEKLCQFIENYPKLFSKKKFNAWRQLFDDHATMTKIKSSKVSFAKSIEEAMPEQIEYGEENYVFIEKWDNIESHIYGDIAIIKANYQLIVDSEIREGIDVVTLFYDGQGWRIINLAYEETKHIVLTNT